LIAWRGISERDGRVRCIAPSTKRSGAPWRSSHAGTSAISAPTAQPALDRLLLLPARRLPRMRFVVAGPQYPTSIDWPDNVELLEHVAPADHAAFYAAQRFTLNVTRAAMIAAGWSPSVRLFEAASCGTPIISDRWNGLTELLPEHEAIVIADSTEAVVAALTGAAELDRDRIGEAARSIVLDNHTGMARARELLRHVDAAAKASRDQTMPSAA
jgi:spore maturation protein CgeB